jgi:hypothetical protein
MGFNFPYPAFLVPAVLATVITVALDFRNRRVPLGIGGQVVMSITGGIAVGALIAARAGLGTGLALAPVMVVLFFVSARIRAANRARR